MIYFPEIGTVLTNFVKSNYVLQNLNWIKVYTMNNIISNISVYTNYLEMRIPILFEHQIIF